MERVFICSPFRGAEEKNVELARKYARFAYEKGCLPVVPHLYFPQFLKESDVQERMAGIQFGLSLLKECREVWVFGEIMSEGMCMEIAEADHAGIPIHKPGPLPQDDEYLRELADTYIRGLLEVDAFIQDNLAQEDENNDL